jgi:RNA polymerase-binding transcription factor DksA
VAVKGETMTAEQAIGHEGHDIRYGEIWQTAKEYTPVLDLDDEGSLRVKVNRDDEGEKVEEHVEEDYLYCYTCGKEIAYEFRVDW